MECRLRNGAPCTPIVSAIVPSYNGAAYIRDCLRSVREQSFQELEIVVVDDGSDDDTRSIVAGEAARDPRVRLVEHEGNRGIAAARNTGIRESSGMYVGFLDQDDLWLPGKLDEQLKVFAESPDTVEAVFSDALMIDDDGRSLGPCHREHIPRDVNSMSARERLEAFFLHNFIPIIALLVRRTCLDRIGLFDETIRSGVDDFELCVRLVGHAETQYIGRPVAAHRVHRSNYSSDTARLLADLPGVMETAVAEFPYLADLIPRKRALLHYRLARYHRDAGRFREARANLREAARADPSWATPRRMMPLYALDRLGLGLLAARRIARRALVRPGHHRRRPE